MFLLLLPFLFQWGNNKFNIQMVGNPKNPIHHVIGAWLVSLDFLLFFEAQSFIRTAAAPLSSAAAASASKRPAVAKPSASPPHVTSPPLVCCNAPSDP